MMSTTLDLTSVEAFAELEDEGRMDLIDGRVLLTPWASGLQGAVEATINYWLANYVVEHDIGETYAGGTGFILDRDPDTVLTPDVAFVRAERLPPREERRGFLELAPDLVVETVSDTDLAQHINEKLVRYLEAGVGLVWIVDPWNQIVMVWTPDFRGRILRVGDELSGGDVLPSFSAPVKELFQ